MTPTPQAREAAEKIREHLPVMSVGQEDVNAFAQIIDRTARQIAAQLIREAGVMTKSLSAIAGQKLTIEMNEDEGLGSDFETGYDMCIEEARAALAKLKELQEP
jgi:hypothetical protein